ncbi:MAG: class I SAM-dependent methyltransferase [Chloroflexi bacterium]|nr:class I SAM-dependent methyltransferase [Chloroflexota bacterium]
MTTRSDTTPTARRRASWYQRLFASMMATQQRTWFHYYDSRKRALLSDLHGDVLEIGPGTGSNLAYYARDVRWLGLEPNPAMFPYAQQEAQRLGMVIQLREGRAEQVDAADNSFSAVVSTLVLCSVPDPQRTLSEILRVLKPGGRFVFIEHVAAPRESGLRRRQRIMRPVWKIVSDGCHPDRETWVMIEKAGFSSVQIDHFRLKVPIAGPHISGYAVK